MKKESKLFIKILSVLLIIILLSCAFPRHSDAGVFTGVLTKPICFFIVQSVDSINVMLSALTVPSEKQEDFSDFIKKLEEGEGLKAYYSYFMSPDKIFKGDVTLLNANIFTANAPGSGSIIDWFGKGDISLASALQSTISNIYVLLRNICAVVMLCLLIYTGIRILIKSASPYDQAKWKGALLEWIKGLCLLMFMHFIMIGVFYISDLFVDALAQSFGDSSIVANIRAGFTGSLFDWDDSGAIITTILYIYVTYLTIVFFIAYFKRFVWIVILTLISPVIATTYAMGGSQTKVFNRWIKEYIFAVALQPFHMLIFYVLVAFPLELSGNNGVNLIQHLDPLNQTSIITNLYVLLSIAMIRPAEKFFMKLFGFNEASVAKQGSSESGVKTIKAVEKVVKEVVTTAVQIGAAVATGGASAAAGAAGGASAAAGATGGASAAAGGAGAIGPTEGAGAAVGGAGESLPLGEGLTEGIGEDTNGQTFFEDAFGNDISSGNVNSMNSEVNTMDIQSSNVNENTNDLIGAAQELSASAADLSEAAEELRNLEGKGISIPDAEFEVSDAEFDNMFAEKKQKNRLRARLEGGLEAGARYIESPVGLERLNETRAGLNEIRDSMYLDGDAPRDWQEGYLGYKESKERIDQNKNNNLNAFVNNKNNINYMMKEHGLGGKEAKERLKEGEPYINRGITDVAAVDRLISASGNGKSVEGTMKSVSKVESVVNSKSNISTVARIIADKTGEDVKSSRVQEEAKNTMQQARPYVEKGEKDPEVLHRLVQLESQLKTGKISSNARTPEKVMKMDKIIDKAVKEKVKKIEITGGKETSEGMKQLESVMNKALDERKK